MGTVFNFCQRLCAGYDNLAMLVSKVLSAPIQMTASSAPSFSHGSAAAAVYHLTSAPRLANSMSTYQLAQCEFYWQRCFHNRQITWLPCSIAAPARNSVVGTAVARICSVLRHASGQLLEVGKGERTRRRWEPGARRQIRRRWPGSRIGYQEEVGREVITKAMAATDASYGVHGHVFGMSDLAFAGYIATAGVLFVALLVLLYRGWRFITLEIALRRHSIPLALYPPKGSAYPAHDVHTICVVCISEFRRYDRVAVLPACSHVFHRRCLREEVARANPRCPLCRAALA